MDYHVIVFFLKKRLIELLHKLMSSKIKISKYNFLKSINIIINYKYFFVVLITMSYSYVYMNKIQKINII